MEKLNAHNPEKDSKRKWLAWLSLALFSLFQVSLQGCLGIFANGIKESFLLDATAIGILSSSFFYPYVIMQLPVGCIYDHFPLKRVSLVAAFTVAISCIGFGLANSFYVALFFRILMGLGSCFAFVGVISSLKKWFPKENFSLMTGLTESLTFISVAVLNLLLSKIVLIAGWRYAILTTSLIVLVILFLIQKNVPIDRPLITNKKKGSFLRSIIQVARSKHVWIAGLYGFFSFSIISVYVALWGIPYLLVKYPVDLVSATSIISMIFWGAAIGSPLVGYLGSRVKCSTIAILGGLINTALIIILTQGPIFSILNLYVIHFTLGFFGSVYLVCFLIVGQKSSDSSLGAAIGMTNMIKMSSGPVFQPLIGLTLSYLSDGVVMDGPEKYSVSSYEKAFLILVVCSFISITIGVFLDKKEQVETDEIEEELPKDNILALNQ